MTSEASWQAQTNEQEEWDADHDLHMAWCNVAMDLADNYAEAYCNHQCDDSKDCLQELGRTRLELKRHLWGQPASMGSMPDPGTDYAHRLAIMLECALLDPQGTWNEAHQVLDEYNRAVQQWNEAHGIPYVSGFGKD